MSLWIMIIIIVLSSIVGGVVNYLLPANNPEPKKFLKPIQNCILLGLGATFLVPLFLEIAQSKLMDDIHFSWEWSIKKDAPDSTLKKQGICDSIIIKCDSTIQKIKIDTAPSTDAEPTIANDQDTPSPAKQYLLWAAYCMLAAAAGFKFINMLINNVVKEEQLTQQKSKITDLEKEKIKREKNSQISQQQEDENIRATLTEKTIKEIARTSTVTNVDLPILPVLPNVLHPDDPQKGRFGGMTENSGRKLSAEVKESTRPGYYNVKLIVESTDQSRPLNSDVVFYIHDSFSPSVFSYSPAEFVDGKAIEDEILSYGAFTIGVITDNGKTLLELDLSENKSYPREFRER
jgi:hypothetical protein